MQRVAILHLGQTTDHKRTRILRAEKLDLADPIQKLLTLLIRWLLVRVLWRHVVGFHDGKRLLPPMAGRSFAGVLEGGSEVDATLLSLGLNDVSTLSPDLPASLSILIASLVFIIKCDSFLLWLLLLVSILLSTIIFRHLLSL